MQSEQMNGTPSSEQSHALTHPPDGTLAHYLGVRHAGASALAEPITAKRVYFYKSGDPQFGGLKVAINNRTFKTFDALLDNLSRRMPLPFGVRTVSTPRGLHAVRDLEQLEDGKAYVCSDRRRAKPLDLEQASRRPQPWRSSRRPLTSSSSRRQALRLLRRQEMGGGAEEPRLARATPRRLTLVRNGDATGPRYALLLSRRSASSGLAGLLADASQIMGFSVARLYTTDGRKVESLQALLHVPSTLVAAGREPFQPLLYDAVRLPLLQNPRGAARAEGKTINLGAVLHKRRVNPQLPSGHRSKRYSIYLDKPSGIRPLQARPRAHSDSGAAESYRRGYTTNDSFAFASSTSTLTAPAHALASDHSQASAQSQQQDQTLYQMFPLSAAASGGRAGREAGGGGEWGTKVVPMEEDDIEKKIHVNPDGSMTVEMRVRFRLHNEVVTWKTRVSRESTAHNSGAAAANAGDVRMSRLTGTRPPMEFSDFALRRVGTGSERGSASKCWQTAEECLEGPVNYDIWKNPAFRMSPNPFDVGSLDLSCPGASLPDRDMPPPPPSSPPANEDFVLQQESRQSSAVGSDFQEEFLQKVVAFMERRQDGRGALEFHTLRRRVFSRSGRVFPSVQRPSTAGARLVSDATSSSSPCGRSKEKKEASTGTAARDAMMEMREHAENGALRRWGSRAGCEDVEVDHALVEGNIESRGDEREVEMSNCSSDNTYVVSRSGSDAKDTDDVEDHRKVTGSGEHLLKRPNSLQEADAGIVSIEGNCEAEDPSLSLAVNSERRVGDVDAMKPRGEERLSSAWSSAKSLARHTNSNGATANVDETDRFESRSATSALCDKPATTPNVMDGDRRAYVDDSDGNPQTDVNDTDGDQRADVDDNGAGQTAVAHVPSREDTRERSPRADENGADAMHVQLHTAPRPSRQPLPPEGRPSASARKTRLREQAENGAGAARQPRRKPAESGAQEMPRGGEGECDTALGSHENGARDVGGDGGSALNGDESDAERTRRMGGARRDASHFVAPASLPSTSPNDTIREWLVKISSNPEALEDDLTELGMGSGETHQVNGEAQDGASSPVFRGDDPSTGVDCRTRKQGIETEISVIRKALQRSPHLTTQSLNMKVRSFEKDLHPSDVGKKKQLVHCCEEAKLLPRDGNELMSVKILKNIIKCKDKLMLDKTGSYVASPASEVQCNGYPSRCRHRPATDERCEQLRDEALSFLEFLGQLGSLEDEDCIHTKRSSPVQASTSEKLLKAWKDIRHPPPEGTPLAERPGDATDYEKSSGPSHNTETVLHTNHVQETHGDCGLPSSVVNGIITNGEEEEEDSEMHDGLEPEDNYLTHNESISQGVQNGISGQCNDNSSFSGIHSSLAASAESTCDENDRHSSEETSSLTSVTSDEEDVKSSDVGAAPTYGSVPPSVKIPRSDVGVNWHLNACHTPLYRSPVDTIPEEEPSECNVREQECGIIHERRMLPCVWEMLGEEDVRDVGGDEALERPEENGGAGANADVAGASVALILRSSEDRHSESDHDAPESMLIPEEIADTSVCGMGTSRAVNLDDTRAVFDTEKSAREVTRTAKVVTKQPAPTQGGPVLPARDEGDFLDRMYTACGNSCPILTAVEAPDGRDRSFVYQKPSDPENMWVGWLLKKVGKTCVWHYSNVMHEFKLKWDLGENKEVDEMIQAVQEEVSKRIRQSIHSEMKNVEAEILERTVPRPPLSEASHRSTNSTKLRRMRMESLRKQPTYQDEKTKRFSPVIEELNRKHAEKQRMEMPVDSSTSVNESDDLENASMNAGGVDDEVDGEEDDEDDEGDYCPCEDCLANKFKKSRCAKELIASTPVMQAFDLRQILNENKDKNVQKDDAKRQPALSRDNAMLDVTFDLKAILKDKAVTKPDKKEREQASSGNNVKAIGEEVRVAEGKSAEEDNLVKQERAKQDEVKDNTSNQVIGEKAPVGAKGNYQAIGVEMSGNTETRMVLNEVQQRGLWEREPVNKDISITTKQQEGNGLDDGFKRSPRVRRKCNMDHQMEATRQGSVDEGKGSSPDSETVDGDTSHFSSQTKLPAIVDLAESTATVVQMASRVTTSNAACDGGGRGQAFPRYKSTVTVLQPFRNDFVVARDRAPPRAKPMGAAASQKLPPIHSNTSMCAVHGSDDRSTLELEDASDGGDSGAEFSRERSAPESLPVVRACGCKCTCEGSKKPHRL